MELRQVVLDTETTGLEPAEGHRIIEIGCVELVNRRLTGRHFHQYLQPDRLIDAEAAQVHGITNEMLQDMPHFGDVAHSFLEFVTGAELVIHNAAFDIGFLDHELRRWRPDHPSLATLCEVLDTLVLARQMHPGQRNSLDALCRRYGIDNSHRTLHGALLDAEILADLYLAMTGGQVAMWLDEAEQGSSAGASARMLQRVSADRAPLPVLRADDGERAAHETYLDGLDRDAGGTCIWRRLDSGQTP